jgi:hypothetical protein
MAGSVLGLGLQAKVPWILKNAILQNKVPLGRLLADAAKARASSLAHA